MVGDKNHAIIMRGKSTKGYQGPVPKSWTKEQQKMICALQCRNSFG